MAFAGREITPAVIGVTEQVLKSFIVGKIDQNSKTAQKSQNISHRDGLFGAFAKINENPQFCDVTLIVNDSHNTSAPLEFKSLRGFLALRSPVFAAMLFGKMMESTQKTLKITAPPLAFKIFLTYVLKTKNLATFFFVNSNFYF